MASLQLVLDILARDNASKEFRNVGDAVDGTADKAGKAGGIFSKLGPAVAAGAAIAGVAVAGFGLSAIGAASDLEQTRIKIGNVFGPAASKIVENFAKDSANAFGISKAATLDAAGTFGTFFTQLGFTQEQSAKTSGEVIKLAADLGSFNNLPTAEVLDAINSSLRGEFDSLQRLVPTINAAAVEQRALADSGKTAAKSLTEQEKATATLALISEGGALALNDLAESSDTLAIRQQVLKAKFEDAKTALGTALLPAATAVAGFFTDKFVPAVERLVQQFKDGEGTGGKLREKFEAIKQSLIDNKPQIEEFGRKLVEVGEFVLTKVIPAFITVYQTTLPAVVDAFQLVFGAMTSVADLFTTFLSGFLGGLGSIFGVLAKIPGPFQSNFKAAAGEVNIAKGVVDGFKIALDSATRPKTAKVDAKVSGADDVDSLGARVARLRDKTITITTTEVQRFIVEGQRAAGRGFGERAEGGPVRAGQPYLVGERGPELIVPPRNGFVLTAGQTASALAPSTGSGVAGGGNMSALLDAVNGLRSDVQRQARQFQQLDRQRAGV